MIKNTEQQVIYYRVRELIVDKEIGLRTAIMSKNIIMITFHYKKIGMVVSTIGKYIDAFYSFASLDDVTGLSTWELETDHTIKIIVGRESKKAMILIRKRPQKHDPLIEEIIKGEI